MSITRPTVTWAVFVMLLCAAAARGEEVDLTPRWQKDQTSVYKVLTERKMTMRIDGPMGSKSTGFSTVVEGELEWKVIDAAADGGGVARLSTRSMKMTLTDPKGNTHTAEAGRADEAVKAMSDLIRAYVDTPITVHVSSDGTIEKIEGLKEMQSRAGDQGKSISQSSLDDMVRETALLCGVTDDLKPGDAWKHAYETTIAGKAEASVDTRYQFIGAEKIAGIPIAAVSGVGEVKIKKPELNEKARFEQTEGKENSQTYYDLSRSEIVGRNVDAVVGFRVQLQLGADKLTQETTIHMNSQVLRMQEK